MARPSDRSSISATAACSGASPTEPASTAAGGPTAPASASLYDNGGGPQCWLFRPRPGGFAAALVEGDAETGFVLELAGSDTAPLDCPGPWVGS